MRTLEGRMLQLRHGRISKTASALRRRTMIDRRTRRVAERIVQDVRKHGDRAVRKWTYKLDGVLLHRILADKKEIRAASSAVIPENVDALRFASKRLCVQTRNDLKTLKAITFSEPGIRIQTTFGPIGSAGCYVPGGSAAYPSSFVMSVVPARVAGVRRVVVCSPPAHDGSVSPLVAAASQVCNVDELYKIGGPQAVAAMAYGTETIRPVDKIVGPGGPYVTAAKQIVAQDVAIDLPAGPTELLIIAFGKFDEHFIAHDLVAQAEHSPWSVCGVITDSATKSRRIIHGLNETVESAFRTEVVSEAIRRSFFVCVAKNLSDAAEFANCFAPEHAQLMGSARVIAKDLKTSGLVLVGDYTPSAASDYTIGSNHILPTGGLARSYSGLSARDFLRRQEIVSCTREGLRRIAWSAIRLARAEGLDNHAVAILERIKN